MTRRTLDLIFATGGLLMAGLILVLGLVLQNQANFAEDYVHDQLAQQKIVFTPEEFLGEDTQAQCLKDNAGKYVLKVGKTQSGTARYAQKDGNDTIYVIPSWAADWAIADVTKFQKPADAGAPKPTTAAIPGGANPHGDPHGH